MNKLEKLVKDTIKNAIFLNIIFLLVGMWFFENPVSFGLGLLFGAIIGVINFIELGRTLNRAVHMHPGKAQNYTSIKYFARFFISAVVLYTAVKAEYISVIGTIIGLLSIKFVILGTNLFSDKEYFKNIFIRKEE